MKNLIQLLTNLDAPFTLTEPHYLEFLSSEDYKKLSDLKIIIPDGYFKFAHCTLCLSSHEIENIDTSKPQIYCSEENALTTLQKKDFIKLRLDISLLMQLLFKCKNIEKIENNELWYIGKRKILKQNFAIYFYMGNTTDIIATLNKTYLYNIIFYFHKPQIIDCAHAFVSLTDALDMDEFSFDFTITEQYVSKNLLFVEFTKEGRVLLYRKEITSLAPASPAYFFFEYLYNNFGIWKTNNEIYKYVQDKTKEITRTGYRLTNPQEFSKSMVKEIKRIATDKKAISTIIKNNKKTAYRIMNPA